MDLQIMMAIIKKNLLIGDYFKSLNYSNIYIFIFILIISITLPKTNISKNINFYKNLDNEFYKTIETKTNISNPPDKILKPLKKSSPLAIARINKISPSESNLHISYFKKKDYIKYE